jgi:hypothetical protein
VIIIRQLNVNLLLSVGYEVLAAVGGKARCFVGTYLLHFQG